MNYAIALDIGGTKIAAGLINELGEVSAYEKLPSKTGDKESMFKQVVAAIDAIFAQSDAVKENIIGIGVGLPGKVDRENGVAVFQNNLPWTNFPLKERLLEVYPKLAILIENDVAVAAYGEYFLSKVETGQLFTYITLSTGVASASILNNELIKGNGFSGELGLIPVQAGLENNELRILEKCTSGVAIEEYGKQFFNDQTITTKDVFDKFYDGDETAENILNEVARSLAIGFTSVISLLDPNKIVVGGSVAVHHPALVELVKKKLANYLLEAQHDAIKRITVSTSPDAALIGSVSRLFE
ncbi:glucokinase [Alkalibacterium gilvum]|uniref:Glucokinase n=1 Tax=Alkalibacterium gilvum TaxID=1130080 RepID=A0A1H6RKN8_9LACT|nr:ROK family protein [Alkalibacterium gilvum]SEI56371.1 glucokinase [Alkalibacterium gilvum]